MPAPKHTQAHPQIQGWAPLAPQKLSNAALTSSVITVKPNHLTAEMTLRSGVEATLGVPSSTPDPHEKDRFFLFPQGPSLGEREGSIPAVCPVPER